MRDFSSMAVQLDQHRAEHPTGTHRLPTAFKWQDPNCLPRRPWVYGRNLLRKQVAVTVAPGGVRKSALTIVEGRAMVS